jgi:hypothetical protein
LSRRSDDCDEGRGPVLRDSVYIRAQPSAAELQRLNDGRSSVAAASATAAAAVTLDLATKRPSFSAAVRARAAHTVTACAAAADEEGDDPDGFEALQLSNIFSDEADATASDQHSPVLKEGWLLKLARFGRNMRRYACNKAASCEDIAIDFRRLAFCAHAIS